MRPTSLPTCATRLSAGNIHVIDVANLADRRETVLVNPAHFTRRHLHQRVTAFEVIENRLLACAARDLSAAARTQFNVVNVRAERNRAQRQRIPEIRRNIVAGDNLGSDLKPIRSEDVAHYAIGELNKSDARRAIRVVFNADHFRGHTVFTTFEIDLAIMLLVTAADVT